MRKIFIKFMVVMSIPFLLMEMAVRDFNTFCHSWTTAIKSYLLAKQFNRRAIYMFFVGLCHDFGKIDLLRTKDGSFVIKSKDKLSDEQFALIKTHQNSKTAKWVAILFPEVEYHHEKSNGRGYRGITNLTFEMELIGVADVFSALKMKRNYKDAMKKEQVKEIMEKMSLNQNIVKVC